TWLLYRAIIVRDGLSDLAAALRHPSPGLRRFLLLLLPCAAAVAASILWLDRPLFLLFAGMGGVAHRIFRFITEFGVSTPYLVIAVLLAAAFGIAARGADDRARQSALALAAWRSAFVFAAVAGTGLAADLLKPVFGRARPKLYVQGHIFGFTWHGAHSAYWSFPSGHSVTIVALATALSLIDRRWRMPMMILALLVMASRVVLGEHYLSDVIAGAFIAWSGTLATATLFRRAGAELALNSP
ncbi:MAG: phosphatase PAP2 family protein, partial [Stellaceae bacterium]